MEPVKPAATSSFRSSVAVLIDKPLPEPLASMPLTLATTSVPRVAAAGADRRGERAGRNRTAAFADDAQVDNGVGAVGAWKSARSVVPLAVAVTPVASLTRLIWATNSPMLVPASTLNTSDPVRRPIRRPNRPLMPPVAAAPPGSVRNGREPSASRHCSCRRPSWSPARRCSGQARRSRW